jgi:hypothetical protein
MTEYEIDDNQRFWTSLQAKSMTFPDEGPTL